MLRLRKSGSLAWPPPWRWLTHATLASAVALGLIIHAPARLHARQPAIDENLRFEAASIRRHTDPASVRVGIEDAPSLVRIDNMPLRALIRIAYGVLDGQIEPGKLDGSGWDIVATPPDGYHSSQLPVLIRNLLADRFGLVVHRETRNVTALALRPVSSGHRLIPSQRAPTFLTGRPGLIAGDGRTIGDIVPIIARMVSAPVVDQTGLTERYDIKLEWTPQLSAEVPAIGAEPDVSIGTALQEQLGLRLVPHVMPVEAVIIDSVEREPTAN